MIENGTPETTTVTITVGGAESREGEEPVSETIVNVPGRNTASGKLVCGQKITLAVVVGGGFGTGVVELSGDGTGTPGFDSGTVGAQGERFLFVREHFACSDTVLIRIATAETGEVSVIAPGDSLPDPIDPGDSTDPVANDRTKITVRLENATATAADFLITPSEGEDEGGSSRPSSVSRAATSIRVPPGEFSTGEIECGPAYVLSGTIVNDAASAVQYSGDGTGTAGFDGTSIGPDGERLLIFGDHYACGNLIVVRVTDDGRGIGPATSDAPQGDIKVFASGEPVPEPDLTDPGDSTDQESNDRTRITVRLENATATAADFLITPKDSETAPSVSEEDEESSTDSSNASRTATPTSVRVPAGQSTVGDIECGPAYTVSATMVDDNGWAVQFAGDGTGTAGFDSASVGPDGERLLIFGDHYRCGNLIVARVTDDGSGIGPNTSHAPQGDVNVFATGEPVPEPDLPDPDDLADPETAGIVTLTLVNSIESTVQVNVATGSGALASSGGREVTSEFDVRVPPGTQTTGTTACAQEYVIAASHLQASGTTATVDTGDGLFAGSGASAIFHSVVLTGAGTGTEGFDSISLAILRGRLLQLGTHFECGDTITVVVTATNNQIKLDATGEPILDAFGNPTIKYNVGSGFVTVTPGS